MNERYYIKLEKVIVYVIMVKFDADQYAYYSLSKPCVECTKGLRKMNIRKVCWSIGASTFEMCKPCDLRSEHVSRSNRMY